MLRWRSAVRRRRPDIRVVARLLGREPSTHVTERGAAFAASPWTSAAPPSWRRRSG